MNLRVHNQPGGFSMSDKNEIIIGLATASDIPAIAVLEQNIWDGEGLEKFSIEHLTSWLEVNADGFFSAKVNGDVVGYAFVQIMRLDPSSINLPATFVETIDHGFCRATHNPEGNFHYCITVCSIRSGAGRLLVDAMLKRANLLRKPLIGVSRVAGLAEHLKQARGKNAHIDLDSQDELALAWQYASKSAKMVSGDVAHCTFSMNEGIVLPDLAIPDSILAGYMKSGFTLVRPLQNYIRDPKSANFGMLCRQNSLA
jgi:hypothetical protein